MSANDRLLQDHRELTDDVYIDQLLPDRKVRALMHVEASIGSYDRRPSTGARGGNSSHRDLPLTFYKLVELWDIGTTMLFGSELYLSSAPSPHGHFN